MNFHSLQLSPWRMVCSFSKMSQTKDNLTTKTKSLVFRHVLIMVDVLVDVLVFSLWGYSWLRAVPIRTLIVSSHWGRKGVFGDYDDDRVDDPDPRLAKLMPPPLLGVVLVLGCEFPYFFYNFWGLFLLFDTIGVSCEARGTWLLPYALSVGEHFTGSLWETWQFFGWAQDFDLGYVPAKKIKICGWDLPKNPMLSDL